MALFMWQAAHAPGESAGGIPISEDSFVALERARELVGEAVWTKLSGATQARILHEELRLLGTNCQTAGGDTEKHFARIEREG